MSAETASLAANARQQIARLLTQLADLEEAREVRVVRRPRAENVSTDSRPAQEFDDDEYEETRAETLTQLEEFKTSLARMSSGDVTLRDELQAVKEATHAAIASAFRAPEVLKMFALGQTRELRERVRMADRDVMLGKMSERDGEVVRVEALTALKKMGATLDEEELTYLRAHMTKGLTDFVAETG